MTPTQRTPFRFTIPVRTVSEANQRDHWAKRARRVKEQRGLSAILTVIALENINFTRKHKWCIALTRVSPGTLDDDNLRSSMKAVRDGIADAFGWDDRDPRLVWEYDQRHEGREYWVEVEIR